MSKSMKRASRYGRTYGSSPIIKKLRFEKRHSHKICKYLEEKVNLKQKQIKKLNKKVSEKQTNCPNHIDYSVALLP